jgi:formamidopyrimidine-DNA glycosylase
MPDEGWERLAAAADLVLGQALQRARETITTDLPTREKRVHMVHGHAGDPCLRCGETLARVSFADFDLVYCPTCQTGGRRYADRRTSRFLR